MREELSGMSMAMAGDPTRGEAFRRDLAALLNRYSMENGSNTPDYLLADYLIQCLRALDSAVRAREKRSDGFAGQRTSG